MSTKIPPGTPLPQAIPLPQPSEALHIELDELADLPVSDSDSDCHEGDSAQGSRQVPSQDPNRQEPASTDLQSKPESAKPSPELQAYLRELLQACHERLVAIPLASPLRVNDRALAWLAGRMLGAEPSSRLAEILQDLSQQQIATPPPRSPASLDAFGLFDFITFRGADYPKKAPPAAAAREFASYALWEVDPESRARVWSRLRSDRMDAALAITRREMPPRDEIAALNTLFFADPGEEARLPASADDPLPPSKHPFNLTRWTIFVMFLLLSAYHLTCR